MGLLTKALDQNRNDNSLLKRAMAVRERAEETVNPLPRKKKSDDGRAKAQKVDGSRKDPGTEPAAPQSAEDAVRKILGGIGDITGGLQAPVHLFSLLTENLSLRRAAMLLPDYDDGTFVPWASTGLDATSVNRLRIAREDIQALQKQGAAGALWSGDSLTRFAPYFSHREASMLEHLLILPFSDGSDTQAVMLVTDTPHFEDGEEILRIILAAIGRAAAELIGRDRVERIKVLRHAVAFKRDEIDVVASRIVQRTGRSPLLLRIELSDFVSQIATSNAHSDSFRIWQDVLRAVAALFASTASVCDGGNNRALVLIHEEIPEDLDIVAQQIAVTLWKLFPELGGATKPRYESNRPEENEDPARAAIAML